VEGLGFTQRIVEGKIFIRGDGIGFVGDGNIVFIFPVRVTGESVNRPPGWIVCRQFPL